MQLVFGKHYPSYNVCPELYLCYHCSNSYCFMFGEKMTRALVSCYPDHFFIPQCELRRLGELRRLLKNIQNIIVLHVKCQFKWDEKQNNLIATFLYSTQCSEIELLSEILCCCYLIRTFFHFCFSSYCIQTN